MKLKPRESRTVLLECIEVGLVGGLNKLDKWDIDARVHMDEAIRILTDYVMANIEEEFDLE